MTTLETSTFGAEEMGRRLGKSADWVYRHLDQLPHTRVGRSLRFTDADVDTFIRRHKVDSDRVVTTRGGRR